MSTNPQEAQNLVEAAAQATAAAAATAQQAAAQTGNAVTQPSIAFSFDEKGAETVFGKPGEDGRPANVAPKYWDADGKKIKADVVLNQLRWAEGKIGKPLEIIGAPATDYAITMPKDAEGHEPDFKFAPDDPAIKGFLTVARKHDISQTFVDEVVGEVVKMVGESRQANLNAEVAKLGTNGIERIGNIDSYLRAHLSKEQVDTINATLTSAAAFEAFEALIRTGGAPTFVPRDPANTAVTTDGKMTAEQWNALNFEMIDQGGQKVRRRSVDPAFNAMVEAKRDEVFGTTRRNANGQPVTAGGQRI